MKLALIVGLAILTAGCSEESLRKMAEKEDLAMSEKFVRDIQSSDDAAALAVTDETAKAEMTALLPVYRSKISTDPKAKMTLVGVGTEKSAEYGGESVDQAKLDYEFGTDSAKKDLRIKINRYEKGNRIASFEIDPKDDD